MALIGYRGVVVARLGGEDRRTTGVDCSQSELTAPGGVKAPLGVAVPWIRMHVSVVEPATDVAKQLAALGVDERGPQDRDVGERRVGLHFFV